MWRRSRPSALRRNLLRLVFDSPSPRPPRPRGGAAAAATVCTCPSRALNYSSSKDTSPFSELLRDSFGKANSGDPIFIKRKVKYIDEEHLYDYDEHHLDEEYLYELDPDEEPDPAAVARFSLWVCSNQALPMNMRAQAVRIIGGIARREPGSLERDKLVSRILEAMFPLLVVVPAGDHLYEQMLSHAAMSVVKTMALNHPERVFPPVLGFASRCSQNSDFKYRVAAVTALRVIAEGCSGLIKDELEPVLGIVLTALGDVVPTVREDASLALLQLVRVLRPEMVSRSRSVLPGILSALRENNVAIEKYSYRSLQALCESMTGEEILPYLDPIMDRLLADLRSDRSQRYEWSLWAMCYVAVAAGQHFVPYAERALEALTRISIPDTEDLVLAGVLVTTVGRAGVEPMIGPYIKAAASSFGGRTLGLGFFCIAAETLSDGFAKYLPDLVPLAISYCNRDEYPDGPAADEDDYPDFRFFWTRELEEKLDEKAAAARALGLFAVHTKSAFAPYLEESMRVVINLSAHHHEDVRLQAVIGLKNILTAAAAVPSESPSGGAAKAKQLLGTVMDRYIKAMDEDGSKSVVAQVCTNTAGILEDFGYAALEPYVPQIIDSAFRLLQGRQSACQRTDDAEHEETLAAAVSNLLSAFAKAAATSRFAPSMCSMLSDGYKIIDKAQAAPGSSQYRTTVAA